MKHEKHMQKEIDRKAPFLSPISVVLRAYRPSACSEVLRLFYDTVHTVNAKDYTEEQLDAWADGKPDAAKWNESLCAHFSLAAEADGILAGFGDIDETGYLDRLYVHRDFQGMGVGTALCQALEQEAARAVRQTKARLLPSASPPTPLLQPDLFLRPGAIRCRESSRWSEKACCSPTILWKNEFRKRRNT